MKGKERGGKEVPEGQVLYLSVVRSNASLEGESASSKGFCDRRNVLLMRFLRWQGFRNRFCSIFPPSCGRVLAGLRKQSRILYRVIQF